MANGNQILRRDNPKQSRSEKDTILSKEYWRKSTEIRRITNIRAVSFFTFYGQSMFGGLYWLCLCSFYAWLSYLHSFLTILHTFGNAKYGFISALPHLDSYHTTTTALSYQTRPRKSKKWSQTRQWNTNGMSQSMRKCSTKCSSKYWKKIWQICRRSSVHSRVRNHCQTHSSNAQMRILSLSRALSQNHWMKTAKKSK